MHDIWYTLGGEDPMQQHPVTVAALPHNRSFGTFKRDFQLSDACGFVTNGLQVGIVICKQYGSVESKG